MRLIDADAIIDELKGQCADCMNCKERSIGGIVKSTITDIIKIIERQPTAYNVDEVIEKLNKTKGMCGHLCCENVIDVVIAGERKNYGR